MDSIKTGAFIAELRKEMGLTQTALAEKLSISNRTVSKWENGDGYPDITMLPQIAQILGVTVDELLQGEKQTKETVDSEILFDISYTDSAAIHREGQKTFASQKMPFLTSVILSSTLLLACFIMNNVLIARPLNFFNYIIIALSVLLVFMVVSTYTVGNLHIKANIIKNGGKSYESRVIISDKIHCYDGVSTEEYPFESITGFLIGNNVYVVRIYKRLILSLPKDAFGGKQEEFETFMRSKSPSTLVLKKQTSFKILNVLFVILSILLIFAGVARMYVTSDMCFYRNLDDKTHYFYQFKNEFNDGVRAVWADEEIKKDIEEEGSAEYWAEEYLNLERIYDVCATKNSVAFMSYNNNNAVYCGAYVYYEGEGRPWLSSILYQDDMVDKQEHYIKEEDLYLYGKKKNGSISNNNWYLVTELGDNWYYVELHTKE